MYTNRESGLCYRTHVKMKPVQHLVANASKKMPVLQKFFNPYLDSPIAPKLYSSKRFQVFHICLVFQLEADYGQRSKDVALCRTMEHLASNSHASACKWEINSLTICTFLLSVCIGFHFPYLNHSTYVRSIFLLKFSPYSQNWYSWQLEAIFRASTFAGLEDNGTVMILVSFLKLSLGTRLPLTFCWVSESCIGPIHTGLKTLRLYSPPSRELFPSLTKKVYPVPWQWCLVCSKAPMMRTKSAMLTTSFQAICSKKLMNLSAHSLKLVQEGWSTLSRV